MLHRFAIHRDDLISRAQASYGCGAAILYKSYDRCVEFALGFSDHPHDAGHGKGEAETEKWARCGDDDFIEWLGWRQLVAAVFGCPLEGLHGRELRDGHKTSCGDRAQSVFHTTNRFTPDRLSKPDGKFFHYKAAPARCQKMSQFVNNDQEIENQENFDADE